MAKKLLDDKKEGAGLIHVSMEDLEREKGIMRIILNHFEQTVATWLSKETIKEMLRRLADIIREHYRKTPIRKRCMPEAITVPVEKSFWLKVQAAC